MANIENLWKSGKETLKTQVRRNRHSRRYFFRAVGVANRVRLWRSGRTAATDGGEVPSPERIVWIFCTSRSGSSWLRAMLADILGAKVWEEPKVGQVFGPIYSKALEGQRSSRHFVFGNPTKGSWSRAVRDFIITCARGANPDIGPDDYLVVKEPDGSTGAAVILAGLPESRVILLVRDPRDSAASALDGMKRGNWMNENLDLDRRERMGEATAEGDRFLEKRAAGWKRQIGAAKAALDDHPGPKTIVYYEDLLSDTVGAIQRICHDLDLGVPEEAVRSVVAKHSWDNIPESEKGSGKFYRKGAVGGWREDLTPDQARLIERVASPTLRELYPD